MLKKLVFLFIFMAASVFFNSAISAESADYGTDEIYGALPEDARNFMDEHGVSPENGGAEYLTPTNVLNDIWELFLENISAPLKMFTSLLAVILLTSLLGGINDAAGENSVLPLVSSLVSAIIVSTYISGILGSIGTSVSAASDFSAVFVPVFAGIIAVSGQAATASVFTSVMLVVIQILMQLTVQLLLPFAGLMLGVTAAGGLNSDLKIDKLGDGVKKAIIWALGLIMTIFIGILSLQSAISASADSVTLRAAKFAVSNGIPFVGGAVSDALATVKSSISLLKSGVGSFGIIAGSCILFPVMLHALCYRFFLFLAGVASEMFATDKITGMIRCGENVVSILIAVISCFYLFITISTALLMFLCR